MPDLAPQDVFRLLTNDPDDPNTDRTTTFTDDEVDAYLALEDGNVKRAAAQALDVIASDQSLTLKYITDRGLTTDGPKVAADLRAHAARLRAQADKAEADDDDAAGDGGFFGVVDFGYGPGTELVDRGGWWG